MENYQQGVYSFFFFFFRKKEMIKQCNKMGKNCHASEIN